MKFNKLFKATTFGLLATALVACGNNSAKSESTTEAAKAEDKTIKVVASPAPHAEILEAAKPILEKEGYKLEINIVNDYVTPNNIVYGGDADANYFQHTPYLDKFNKEHNQDLVSVGNVHIEPMAIYSKKYKSFKDIKDGAKIAIPSDSTNEGRALILLHSNRVIKLKDPKNLLATPNDIISNPKKIKFQELDAALLPRTLDSVDGAIITANYALQAGFVPSKDALLLEDKNSPYVNVLAVKKENLNNPDIKKLAKALTSEKAKKFINENYKGAVVPAF